MIDTLALRGMCVSNGNLWPGSTFSSFDSEEAESSSTAAWLDE